MLREIFNDFEPRVLGLLELVDPSELKLWTLLDMNRISTWYKGRLALHGEAAHPFLPRKFISSKLTKLVSLIRFRSRARRWDRD